MNKQVESLYQKYGSYFPIGAALEPDIISSHHDLLVKHFNSLTPENAMKFSLVHPRPDCYTFERADQLVDYARQNRMKLRGHNLVWHNQTPDWVFLDRDGKPVSREILLQRMEEHITTVVGRFRKSLYCWDVVNEARADPDAVLFYNDYHETNPVKCEQICRLVKELKERGTPIHGLGLQGHWNIFQPSLDEIKRAIEKYAALGLQLQITELDVSVFSVEDHRVDLTVPTAQMLERQSRFYGDIFKLFREYREVISGVTFWGAADDYTWLDNFPAKKRKNWPLLFDHNHQPKQAFWEVVNF